MKGIGRSGIKYHIENVAKVNAWDNAKKLQWLRVGLTGRAETAIHRVVAESFADIIKALDEKFESMSQMRGKKRSEGWAEFTEDLKTLEEKGFPDLQEAATEQLTTQNYLQQRDHPQVAFSVKQERPGFLAKRTMSVRSYQ